MNNSQQVSPLSLNRLSLYLRCLYRLQVKGIEKISSKELANQFQLSAALIRKDLAQFGEFGIRGVGYEVDHLIDRLNQALGLDRQHRLVVVGMGSLGSALVRFLELDSGAFRVVAALDSDPEKVGRVIGSVQVLHVGDAATVIRETQAEIALLAVPARAAQEAFQILERAGIRAVLNFAPTPLASKPEIRTKNADVRIHLEELAFFLQS